MSHISFLSTFVRRVRYAAMLCCAVLCVGSVASCQQDVDDAHERAATESDVFVSFTLNAAREREVRAVPGMQTDGDDTQAQYEDAYNTLDIVFFNSNGTKATLSDNRTLFHYKAEGYQPSDEDIDNWVDRIYERPGGNGTFIRGVYLKGVKASDVVGKTCVAMLNLPEAVRNRLYPGATDEITTLDALRNAQARVITSADEQLGPEPYPLKTDGSGDPDYMSDQVQRLVMYGETANIQPTAASPRVEVTVQRTVAKVVVWVNYTAKSLFNLSFTGASPKMDYQLIDFPAVMRLGNNFFRQDGQGDATSVISKAVSGSPAAATWVNAHHAKFTFYVNEYGFLPTSERKQPQIILKGTHALYASIVRYWRILLPRGIQRNHKYNLYCTLIDVGSATTDGAVDLQFNNIVVTPWEAATERYFPGEDYPVHGFIGTPNDSQI